MLLAFGKLPQQYRLLKERPLPIEASCQPRQAQPKAGAAHLPVYQFLSAEKDARLPLSKLVALENCLPRRLSQ